MKNNFYITTSIAYVNGAPHLGFAMETIISDCIARFQRLNGKNVYFLTGTDEHGIKIFKTAKEQGISSQELCDTNSKEFQKLTKELNISNDDFIRTTDQKRHWPTAQNIFQKLFDKGDIYKKKYEGIYCIGCECFLGKKDLEDGKCKIHKKEPEKIEEENYFFALSKYSNEVLQKIKNNELKIIPSFRKNEIVNLLTTEGLKDVSFSRPKDILPWGIPTPNDENQNMYVWCDALTNYISALGFVENDKKYQTFWENGEVMHCIGKDIVRFHAGIWIGMLLSLKIKIPDFINIHGFLTSEGEKMSKSTGNAVDPFEYSESFGEDSLRYFLIREVPFGADSDFSKKRFTEIHNSHLANGLGNLVNRIVLMCKKDGIEFGGEILEDFEEKISTNLENFKEKMNNFDLQNGIIEFFDLIDFGNKKMDEIKPWVLKKENFKEFEKTMKSFLELLKQIGYLSEIFIPKTSEEILKILNIEKIELFDEIPGIKGKKLGESKILFEKIENA